MEFSTEIKLILSSLLLITHTFWVRYWRIKLSKEKKLSNSLFSLIGSLILLITGLYGFFSESPIYVLYAVVGMYLFRYIFIPRGKPKTI